ncbi:MAG: hypothetical protein ACKVQB_09235 [Bacteroidia bacterium]
MKRLLLLITVKLVLSSSAFATIIILNGLSHKFKIQGGELYKGVIEVSNTESVAQTVKLYQTDYTFSSNGSADYGAPGLLKRSNAKWIELGENMFTLGPLEKRVINFQILVPKNDSLNGSYWSVIMVEGLQPPDTTKPTGQFNIKTVTRYGVQIITTAGTDGKRELIFNSNNVVKKEEKRLLVVDIENTGEFMFETLLVCELYDEAGKTTKLTTAYRKKLYPNTSALFEIDITSMPIGKYNALLLADCEDDEAFGMQAQVEIKDE